MKFYASKVDGVLIGVTEDDQAKMASLGLDTLVECSANKNRNVRNHRRFFVFIDLAFDMQEIIDDKEELRKLITIRAGHYTIVAKDKGMTYLSANSIAFDKLEEEEFKVLFKKCVDAYLKWRDDKGLPVLSDSEFMRILDFI